MDKLIRFGEELTEMKSSEYDHECGRCEGRLGPWPAESGLSVDRLGFKGAPTVEPSAYHTNQGCNKIVGRVLFLFHSMPTLV